MYFIAIHTTVPQEEKKNREYKRDTERHRDISVSSKLGITLTKYIQKHKNFLKMRQPIVSA